MPDATITYVSKPAGQNIAAATYLAGADEAKALAILAIAEEFLMPGAVSGVNVADAVIEGDGSSIAGTKEVIATFRCADNSLLTFHLPFVDTDTIGQEQIVLAFQNTTNQAGSAVGALVNYRETNFN